MNATNISSSSSSGISNGLLLTPYQLNIWLGLFIFVTGNISSIGNFIVFSSRTFRVRAYSIYLIGESVLTFIYFNYVLVTRMIQKGYQIPIINRYDIICKIREFLSEYTHQVAYTLFTLAAIDRLLSTHRSIAYRRWSNRVSFAYKMIPVVVFFWFLVIGHRLFLYSTSSGSCLPQSGIYEKYDSFFEATMSGLFPPIILIILGCLLLRNVRNVARRRIAPTVIALPTLNINLSYIQQIDAQLTTMLLLQSFIAVPSFLPYGAQILYSSITENWYKSPLRLAWESVFIELIRLFSYLFYSTSFYISLLSSHGFRRQFLHSLRIKRYTNGGNPVNTNLQIISINTNLNKNERRGL